jgi:hypothetical protein
VNPAPSFKMNRSISRRIAASKSLSLYVSLQSNEIQEVRVAENQGILTVPDLITIVDDVITQGATFLSTGAGRDAVPPHTFAEALQWDSSRRPCQGPALRRI